MIPTVRNQDMELIGTCLFLGFLPLKVFDLFVQRAVYIVKVLKYSSRASCKSYVCGEHNFTTRSPTYLFLAKVLMIRRVLI